MKPNCSCTLFNVPGSAHEKFGLMVRFDNVLFANILVSSDPNTKSVEFLWVGAGSTLVLRFYYYYYYYYYYFYYSRENELFLSCIIIGAFFCFVLAILTFY